MLLLRRYECPLAQSKTPGRSRVRRAAIQPSQPMPALFDVAAWCRASPEKRHHSASRSKRIHSLASDQQAQPPLSLGLSCCIVAVVFGLAGCVTAANPVEKRPWESTNSSAISSSQEIADSSGPTLPVRYESASDEQEDSIPSPQQNQELLPVPDPEPAAITPESIPSPDADISSHPNAITAVSGVANMSEANLAADGGTLEGLSSISRNRLANRVTAAPPAGSGNSTTFGAGIPIDAVFGNMSPILRNRFGGLAGEQEEQQFSYPDIHDDPAKRYHDLYGAKEESDPFLAPWIVNLIFEDRWLLAEKDPAQALRNQLQRRMKIDIRDPDPDLANFPNGAYTIPKGRMYIENSPLGLYSSSANGSQPRIYQWEYLIRYGLTDNLEFRVFSNGLSDQAAQGQKPATVGYQPLAFDFKANFWEENTKYFVPAMGVEIYLQTKFLGSSTFNTGTQPSISLLFDQSLPYGIGLEYNFGYTGVQNNAGQIAYQFSYQWSLQREVIKDFDLFFHGFYNAAALPRLSQFQASSTAAIPNVTVVGFGGIWTVNDRLAVFGSYNFGVTPDAPSTFALMGFALAL